MYGIRIKTARINAGLTRKELAEKLGVNVTTITRYENENRSPDPETLASLADILNVSVDYLVGNDDSDGKKILTSKQNKKNEEHILPENMNGSFQGNQLGQLLEKLRKKKNLTFRKAAELTGLSFSYIRSIELNINPVTKTAIQPTPETLRKFAAAYDYPYEDLMRAAGFIPQFQTDDPIQEIIDSPYMSDSRKRLAHLIRELPDETIQSWLAIIDKA